MSLHGRLARLPVAPPVRRLVAQARELAAEASTAFRAVWRRSLQVRVVISTLALSAAVVVVLGLVLQTQIAARLLQTKMSDTLARAEAGRSCSSATWPASTRPRRRAGRARTTPSTG